MKCVSVLFHTCIVHTYSINIRARAHLHIVDILLLYIVGFYIRFNKCSYMIKKILKRMRNFYKNNTSLCASFKYGGSIYYLIAIICLDGSVIDVLKCTEIFL